SESGTPEAQGAPTSPAASAEASTPPAGDEEGTDTPLAGLDPCSLLNKSDAAQFGPVEEPKRKQIGTADTCSWEPDRSKASGESATLGVGIRENAGVQDMNDLGMGVQQTTENGRNYARTPGPGGCTIAIGVTETA